MRNGLKSLLVAAAGAGLAYWAGQRWRAFAAEAHRPLPGDDLVPDAVWETTHSIVVEADAAAIWPWLLQAGYHRGGWYTEARWYAWLEQRLWHTSSPSVDHLLPELQHLAVGDIVPDGPPGTAYFTVRAIEPNHVLALYSTTHLRYALPASLIRNPRVHVGGFSWVFVLEEVEPATTRMTIRARATFGPRSLVLVTRPLFNVADYIMARMMLAGFKRRAESGAVLPPPVAPVPTAEATLAAAR